ncbi:autotransporter-associated beta strand repeat-containing protein [Pseudomonas matsuisoli]|uniref:Autotransporter domain-containing protein n=1 Tax=Pseudomonas matsuisoli TaxID=1515666 RepID=A0A917Q279_9PSED|nr:autotransporter-associated beta strand repeat-containing protein [Pseudomonas matsuisoli]GGK08788.1 hypothetical protein GCM10009304_38570 [Pseudomonas matsuisoli]
MPHSALTRISPLSLAVRLSLFGLAAGLGSNVAEAACSTSGSTVTCIGSAPVLAPSFSSSAPNLTVNLNPGSSAGVLLGLGGNAVTLNGGGATVNNAGTIDPSLLGLLSIQAAGLVVTNPATASRNVTITNLTGGVLKGTSGLLSVSLLEPSGMALNVYNTATSTATVIRNDGQIGANALAGLSLLTGEAPAVLLYGGAQNQFTNGAGGVITGRVGMQGSAAGNRMTNAGLITGSVAMGNSAGGNVFTALTGSEVTGNGGIAVTVGGLAGINVGYAQLGIVDGGAGTRDTLVLQSGTNGVTTGTASASTYQNFENLQIDSGNWTLLGTLANGGTTSITGGTIVLGSADAFGAGAVSLTGGALEANASGLNVANALTLGGTIGVQGANALTLGGTISGTGGITKSGTGALTLSGTNTYSGTTALNGGSLLLANAQALGASTLRVDSASSLGGSATSVANNVILNAALTLPNSDALGLNGVISGTGSLLKTGSGTLSLGGNNSYAGGTTVAAGTVVVGSNTALGTGSLALGGNAALSSGAASVTLANTVNLGSNALTISGDNALGLTGAISGTGRLVKDGLGTLSLGGTNSFGNLTLNAGTLNLASNNALGSASLTVNGASNLTGSVPLVLANAVQLNAALGISGSNATTLAGTLSGATGSLVKTGNSTLTLAGANTFGGGVSLGAGTLQIGNSAALGTGSLQVTGSSTLNALQALTLGNNVSLNAGAALSVPTNQALTLGGNIAGQGGVIKTGDAALTLTGNNTYSGGTTLAGGALVLGSSSALGAGALGVTAASTLSGSQAIALGNDINLSSLLTIGGANSVALNGAINGTGALLKTGGTSLTLNGNNTFEGGTVLGGGLLTVGSDTALGAGTLNVTGAAQLAASGTRTLANDVRLGADLSVAGSEALSLGGVLSGASSLIKTGTGTLQLNNANTFTGGVQLNGGSLLLGNGAGLGTGVLSVGANATASLDSLSPLTIANQINLGGNLNVRGSNDLAIAGNVAGNGSLVKQGNSQLTLTGNNTLNGGLDLEAGSVRAGSISLNGDVRNRGTLILDQAASGTYGNVISGIGSVVKDGSGSLLLSGNNTFTGGLNILNGGVQVSGGAALNDALAVNLANNATARLELLASEAIGSLSGGGQVGGNVQIGSGASLTLGGDNSNSLFGGALLGDGGLIKTGTGNLALTGNSNLGGGLNLQSGSLTVNGALGGTVTAGSGTSVGGTGNLTGTLNVGAGASLAAASGQTLTLGGLNLQAGANLNVALGTPTAPAPLLNVAGDVSLNGTLNVADAGGFGQGVYQIIRYGGALNGDLSLGTIPVGFDLANLGVQANVAGQINLVVSGDSDLQFWNGNGATGNGSIVGGSGTWQSGITNWTDATGLGTNVWTNGFAIFGGTPGTVNVVGSHTITGMQLADGYALTAGSGAQLNLAGTGNHVIRVDPNATANVGVAITGAGALEKRDFGTLVLSADNSYTGGTVISEGILQVSADSQLGAPSGALDFKGGTLRVTGLGYNGAARNILLGANGGGFDIETAANTFTLAQAIGGAGQLTKSGLGTLALTGANSYSGGTALNAGRLSVSGSSALGSGALTVNGNATLAALNDTALANDVRIAAGSALTVDGESPLALNGTLSGDAGRVIKAGAGTLQLSGANTYGGGTSLVGGTLYAGSDTALGTGVLSADGTGRLDNAAGVRLTNGIVLNGELTLAGARDLVLGGVISGTGALIKEGAGVVTLERANAHTGVTALRAGTLQVNDDLALGTSTLQVGGNAALAANAVRNVANTIALDSGATLSINNQQRLALNGVIGGGGALNVSGAGVLALNGPNTYSGGTTLSSGTLELGNANALGTGALQVVGAAELTSTSALTLANALTLNAALTLPGTFATTLAGPLAGNGTLIKTGNATLGLAGDNSGFGGTVNLGAGELALGSSAALGTSTLNVTGDSILSNSASISLSNGVALGADLTLAGAQDLVLGGTISGAGRLVKAGPANLTLNGPNTHAETELQAGGLTVDVAEALGDSLLVSGIGRLNTTTDNLNVGQNIALAGELTLSEGADLTLSGVLSGSGDLVKAGAQTVTLSGNNTYTGNTRLVAGSLVVGSDTAFGTSRLLAQGGSLTSDGSHTLANRVRLDQGLAVTVADADTLTLSGEMAGAAGLSKTGSGTLVLNGNNRYSGDTTLAEGTLSLGNDAALGAGNLVVTGNATLDHDAPLTVQNGIGLSAGLLTLAGNSDLILNGPISGAGGLAKTGADGQLVLSGNNTFTGGLALQDGGSVLVGNDNALGTGTLSLGGATTLATTQAVTLGNAIELGAALTLAGTYDATLNGALTGNGELVKNGTGTLSLTADNSAYNGRFTLNGGALVGNSTSINGDVTGAAGASLVFDQATDGTYAGLYDGAGDFTKSGASALTLTQAQAFTGALNVLGGTLATSGDNYLGSAGTVNLTAGTLLLNGAESLAAIQGLGNLELGAGGSLTLNTAADQVFAGGFTGSGTLFKTGSEQLTLTGSSSHSGTFNINEGTLRVDGALASQQVNVRSPATLTGSGTLGGNVVVDGTLSASQGNNIFALGSLTLNSNATFQANLGSPIAGATLVNVGSDLTLGGTLSVVDTGGFGLGVYQLFQYGSRPVEPGQPDWTVTGNFDPAIQFAGNGTVTAADLAVQKDEANKAVNLLVGGNTIRYWGGAINSDGSLAGGGAGSWSTTADNWSLGTNLGGRVGFRTNDFAVFAGPSAPEGTNYQVTIADEQTIRGLQFLSDGYVLQSAGSAGITVGNDTPIRVSAGATATINAPISGGSLEKLDGGTLVLGGDNLYTGGTTFSGGIVQASSDANLGALGGGLTFNGGRLQITGESYIGTGRNVTLTDAGGTLDIVEEDATFTMTNPITGTSAAVLGKAGDGTLVLTGANTYGGGTVLEAGTLLVGNGASLGTGDLTVTGAGSLGNSATTGTVALANNVTIARELTVGGAGNLALQGVVSGIGELVKDGSGELTLAGSNTYTGGTRVNAGTLSLTNDQAIGTGALTLGDGTTLDAAATLALENAVGLGGTVTLTGANLTLAGAVTDAAGTGALIKAGDSTLTLTGNNSYSGGTVLEGGTLVAGNDNALGGGTLTSSDGTTLRNVGTLRLRNLFAISGQLTLDTAQSLVLEESISGDGTLVKTGDGRLVLAGSNSYTGGTTLTSGTVIAGSNTALGSGPLTVTADATLQARTLAPEAVGLANDIAVGNGTTTPTLTLSGDQDLTLNGIVSGAGSLLMTGNNTVTLNGNNTYSGGTTLDAGALVVGNANALGTGSFEVTDTSTLSSGSASGVTLAQAIDLGAALTVGGANNLTLAGDIAGAGSLTKDGPGSLVLSGSNTYTGGTQVIGGGLIGNTTSLQGDIGTAANTSVTFDQIAAGSYTSVISGGGSLIKTGDADLLLTGGNTYSGGTQVQAGSLTGTTGSLQGNIDVSSGASLVFDQADPGLFTGVLTGTGTLVKNGSDALSLNGNNSGFTGTTNIENGQLVVNGQLGSDVVNVVGENASLSGGGNVAGTVNLSQNARLVAGTYLTPLTFENLSLDASSVLDFQLGAPNAPVTLVQVTGQLDLGGTLNIADAGGFGTGVYRLFSYGTLSGQPTLGSLPSGYDPTLLRFQGANNLYSLVVQNEVGEIQFWKGQNTAPGALGGDGVWSSTGTNWEDIDQFSGTWQSRFAVFDGTAGTVTVEGQQTLTGMQFLSDGYRLVAGSGGSLNSAGSADGGATVFNVTSGATASVAVGIAGAGGLNKTGAGTLVLSGNNDYTGGTTVGGGTLQVSADNGLGESTQGVTLNGGTLAIAGADYSTTSRSLTLGALGGALSIQAAENTFVYDNAITGSGPLTKLGAGTLALTGANAYTGGTLIGQGTLRGDSTSLQGSISTGAGTTLEFAQASDGQFNGAIDGTGRVVKNGSGSLTLSGANTYSGGTLINSGSLIGTSDSLQGVIASTVGTQLVFDQAAEGIFAGSYSGAGSLVKNGSGSLTLQGGNSYTGGTQVQAGTLIGNSTSLHGQIDNAATLVFDQASDGLFAGNLSGAGTLVKQGAGALVINSEQGFTGNTVINEGSLFVGTAGNSAAALGGPVLVQPRGRLQGSGTVGSITNYGALSSGVDTQLDVNGSFTQGASGWTRIGLSSRGAGVIRVLNTASLAGYLEVFSAGGYSGDDSFTILTAEQVQGTYDEVVLPDLPLLDVGVEYTANEVNLNVSRNEASFDDFAVTPNQRAVAGALSGLPSGELVGAITGLSAEELPAAYDSLTGELHASTASAMIGEANLIGNTVNDRMRQSCGSGSTRDARFLLAPNGLTTYRNEPCSESVSTWGLNIGNPGTPDYQNDAWGQTIAGWGKLKGDSNTSSLDRSSAGIMIGFDRKWDDDWRVGIAAGYLESTLKANDRASESDVTSYVLSAYASRQYGNVNTRLGVSHSLHEIESKRDINIADFSQRAKADYDARTTQFFGELSYVFDLESVALEPYAALSHSRYRSDRATEKGGEASLSAKSKQNSTQSNVGLRVAKGLDFGEDVDVVVRGSLGWQHAFGSNEADASMRFVQGGEGFKVDGSPMARDAAVVGAGVDMAVSERSRLAASYQGQYSSESRDHSLSLTFSYAF